MPLSRKSRSGFGWRTLLPWMVGAFPIACGLTVMNWQIERDLQAGSRATAEQVIEHVERILDGASRTAIALLPSAGTPCTEAQLLLRGEVTSNAFIRSTNLVKQDRLYCSSLFGAFDEPVTASDYVDGHLWLMDGNSVTPGHPLLVYRASDKDRAA
ncbi:CSS-motif domain-containing protein, partial [uncultured Pseudomonas sp.]|uniref:CSS-motif domain-containing protein n=1 Tax=uncultured Pseudomonas sp. TaxID=114707 RepID=UPI00338FFB52